MTEQSNAEPIRGPAIPAAELQKRILDLIGSLQSREDTNQPNVEKQMGVKMYLDPEWDRNRMYWGQTTEKWKYWFSVNSLRNEPASHIEFYLFHGEEVPDDALPKTCTLSFDELAKELDLIGYKRNSDDFFRMGGNKSAGFRKIMNPEEDRGFSVGLFVYSAENGTEDGKLCIKKITING